MSSRKRKFFIIVGLLFVAGVAIAGVLYATFPVQIRAGTVYVELPPADALETRLCEDGVQCGAQAAE